MTVVVGVDGSERSRVALQLAAQEARWRQVPLVAVSAYEPPLGTPKGGFPVAALHTAERNRATAESQDFAGNRWRLDSRLRRAR